MAHDQFAMRIRPEQILAHDADVIRNACQSLRAGVVAEFEIGEPHIEQSVERLARDRLAMRVCFPNELR